jgi:hypothetical protein
MHQLTAKPRNAYQASKPNLFDSHKPQCHSHIHLNHNKQKNNKKQQIMKKMHEILFSQIGK